jgi:gliding motility-associated-like protein
MHDTDAPGCTGSIRLSISGGTPGYSVLWNAPNTGAQIINLCAGDFVPTIADANGCTQTFDPITVNTFGITGEVTNATCPSDADGAIRLTVTGGNTPYTYQWANGAGESLTGNATLSDVLPGNYRVTITEGSGNELVREFVVGSASNLTVAVEVLTDFNGFGVSCAASEDGVLRASAANGTGEYIYEWTRGEEMVGAQAELSNVPGGLYEVTAIDESGCVVTTEVELSAPPEIIVAETITDVSCTGNADGEIEVRATGGAGNNFYTFEWSTGVSGTRITRLRASTYTVTVTDAFDCQTVRDFSVGEPDPLVVVVETEPATDGCNGTAEAVVTGGTAPFFFTWNSAQTGATITDLCPGNYSVQVTDSRGCTPDEKDSMLAGLVSDRRFPCMEAVAVLTPNGDGDNERFLINCVEEFPGNQLEVYNRWGQLVFEAENYDNNWGGTDPDGNVLPEGPYYYVLVYTDNNGNAQQLKGSLTILRDY